MTLLRCTLRIDDSRAMGASRSSPRASKIGRVRNAVVETGEKDAMFTPMDADVKNNVSSIIWKAFS